MFVRGLFSRFHVPTFYEADGGAGAGGGAAASTTDGDTGDSTPPADDSGTAQKQTDSSKKEPFAVFDDERSFMSRVGREAKKQVSQLLQSLGVEKEDDLKNIVDSQRQAEEAKKTELEKLQGKLTKAEQDREKAISTANQRLLNAEIKLLANELGFVNPDLAIKLVDQSSLEVTDTGEVKGVKEALAVVLQDNPYLKGQTGTPKAGEDFSSGTDTKSLLTMDRIKNMSTDEVASRLPEIMDFMAKNQ